MRDVLEQLQALDKIQRHAERLTGRRWKFVEFYDFLEENDIDLDEFIQGIIEEGL